MGKITDTIFNLEFENLKDFKFPIGEMVGFKIEIDNIHYEFLIHLKENSDKIICMASDAIANPQWLTEHNHFSIDGDGQMK